MQVPFLRVTAACKTFRPSGPEQDSLPLLFWIRCSAMSSLPNEMARYNGEVVLPSSASLETAASSGSTDMSSSIEALLPARTAWCRAVSPHLFRILRNSVTVVSSPAAASAMMQEIMPAFPAPAAQCRGVLPLLLRATRRPLLPR